MVYVFLAEGFEETEALTPVDLLRRAGIDVTTVGVTGKIVTGSHGISVVSDISIRSYIKEKDTNMMVLPGGMPGTLNLEANNEIHDAIEYINAEGGYIAAICAAPSILGHMGILQGKKAICYTGFEKELMGAEIQEGAKVVRDGNIITARGAGVAVQFGHELIEVLKGKEVADKIIKDILW